MPGSPRSRSESQTRLSTAFAKTSSPRAIGSTGYRTASDAAGEPQARLLQLGQRGHGLARVPHPREGRLVGELRDRVAEPPSELVLLALHLDAEEPFEHRVGGLALPVAAHGLVDLRVARQQGPADPVHDVVAEPL